MQDDFILTCGGELKPTSSEKFDTYNQTLSLWNEGKSILRIAEIRRLKKSTILTHVEKLISQGKIDRANLSRILTSPLVNFLPKIHAAFRELNTDRLSPVFEKFNGAHSYDDLRIARMLLDKKE